MTRNELLRYIFWEWIEPIGSALCIALLVMKFIMALYVIPTGSMQPTLHGQGDYGYGDKVLVNKFIYRFEKPERWDVIVFEFPYLSVSCKRCGTDMQHILATTEEEAYEKAYCGVTPECRSEPTKLSFMQKDYIKRCVGVPGDELSIRDGNIVLKENDAWKPSLKPLAAQGELWQTVFDSEEEVHVANKDSYWKGSDAFKQWLPRQPIKFAKGREEVLYFYASNQLRGYGDKGPLLYKVLAEDQDPRFINLSNHKVPINAPIVGDVKIGLELLNQPSAGVLELEVYWNITPYIMQVDFASKKVSIKVAGEVIKDLAFSAISDVSFARLDGQLLVEIGDQLTQIDIPEFNVEQSTRNVTPKIRYKGDDLSLGRVQISRDIFYQLDGGMFSGDEYSYKVMPGEYFAMGDNSFNSYDSRSWGGVPEEKLIGKPLTVFLPIGWPATRMKLIR